MASLRYSELQSSSDDVNGVLRSDGSKALDLVQIKKCLS